MTQQLVTLDLISSVSPSIEDNYKKEFVVEGLKVTLNILDTSGSENYATCHERVMFVSCCLHINSKLVVFRRRRFCVCI